MDLKQQTISALRWSAVQNWGSQAGSLLVFLVLARLLSPDAFGLVALANVFRAFLQRFVEQGFMPALVQRDELEPAHLDTAFWAQLAAGGALTALCFAAAEPLAHAFDQPGLAEVLRALSLLLVVKSVALVPRALLRRAFEFRTLARAAIAGIAVSGAVGIPMALAGYGVWSLVGQQLTYECVTTFVVLWGCRWRPGFTVSRRHLDHLLGYSVHVLGFRIVEFASRRVDQLLVGFFLGEVALGFYSVAHRVLEVMSQVLVSTIRQVVFPAYSRLQSDGPRLRNALTQSVRFTSLVTFPIFLGTAAVASELVPLIFGEQWLAATPLIRILSLSGIVASLTTLLENVLLATGRPDQRLKLGVLTAFITLPLCAIAVQWGVVAMAVSWVVGRAAVLPLVYRAALLAIGAAPGAASAPAASPLRPIALPLCAAAAMSAAILSIGPHQLGGSLALALVVEVGVGAGLYGLAIRTLAPATFAELRELFAMALRDDGRSPGPAA